MSVPVWPSTLPRYFLKDGFTQDAADNLITSQTSVGPAKVRRRSTAGVEPLSGTIVMSLAQVAIFRNFVRNTIKDGAVPFTFPDPFGGADLLVRRKSHSLSPWGTSWRVQLSLEALP
jgi:hypothetical protein